MTREIMFERIRMNECINGPAPKWLIELIREHYDTIEKDDNVKIPKSSGKGSKAIVFSGPPSELW